MPEAEAALAVNPNKGGHYLEATLEKPLFLFCLSFLTCKTGTVVIFYFLELY